MEPVHGGRAPSRSLMHGRRGPGHISHRTRVGPSSAEGLASPYPRFRGAVSVRLDECSEEVDVAWRRLEPTPP